MVIDRLMSRDSSLPAATALLRQHGVQGDDAALASLVESYGAHALTMDHLGGLIGQFLGGDPARAPEAPTLTSPQKDRQALRLARLLKLLTKSIYRRRNWPSFVAFVCSKEVSRSSMSSRCFFARLRFTCERPERSSGRSGIFRSPAMFRTVSGAELAGSIREAITEALQLAPIAGPENGFQESISQAIAVLLEQHETNVENDVEELLCLYDTTSFDVTTEQRPLSWQDQQKLREALVRHKELRAHPLLPFKEPPAPLESAFLHAGWGKLVAPKFADLTPADVLHAYRRVRQVLQRFAIKHLALRRVHEICHLYQQKWQAGGRCRRSMPTRSGRLWRLW